MKRKTFPTKLYWIYFGVILYITITLCMFFPYAKCEHVIGIHSDTSYDFCYMRQMNINELENMHYDTYTVQGSVNVEDVYWRTTPIGECIVINGRYDIQEGTEGEAFIHNLSISVYEQCATLYDVLSKKDSSFYESFPVNSFPKLYHETLTEEDAYIYEGDGWILYASEPLKEVTAVPMPVFVDKQFYIALYAFGFIFISNILCMLTAGRRVNNNSELMDAILEIREHFPAESKEKGKRQFARYVSVGANLNLIYIGIFFICQLIPVIIITRVNGAWGMTHNIALAIIMVILGIGFWFVKVIYGSLLTVYKKKNNLEDEICRVASFALPEYREMGNWKKGFVLYLRITGLLYVAGYPEEAKQILEKSWQILKPKELADHILYLIMLCKADISLEQREELMENLTSLENLIFRYDIETKRQAKLKNKLKLQSEMLRLEAEEKWSELLEKTEEYKKQPLDLAELLGITIIQYKAAVQTGGEEFADANRGMLEERAARWLEIL